MAFSDPAHGDGIVQYFRHSAIAVTQALGAYALYTGAEAQAARAAYNGKAREVVNAQAQITTLDTQTQHDAATIGAQAGQIATLTAQVAQLQAQMKSLEAQLAAAIHQGAAPTTPAEAITLFTQLLWAEAEATLKAASLTPPSPTTPMTAG